MFGEKKAQSTVEYAIIIAVVIAALLGINMYMKKGVQGKLKESTDQIGRQFDPAEFTSSWKTASSGETKSTETRDVTTGNTDSTIDQAETITRSEYDEWGTAPGQHY